MITTDDDGDYQIAQPFGNSEELRELTSGPRKCASCLGAVGREEYFAGDYYCAGCVEHADDFPWRTTGTVLGYAP